MEEILASPTIYGPLTKLQCCPTSDGSAAVIVVSEDFANKHGLMDRAVEILGMEMTTDLPSAFGSSSMRVVRPLNFSLNFFRFFYFFILI